MSRACGSHLSGYCRLSNWTEVQPYSISRSYGTLTSNTFCRIIGSEHFVATDSNPLAY
ncbi:hypothetical protein [Flavobacterium seoulense]|uniref:hypothetical protein n=1 Tax=Flavobacterium seoulense TaxID=1492738 RepID=UPI00136288B9|nr:hypothetical protein [Flavobacterium seoulense]